MNALRFSPLAPALLLITVTASAQLAPPAVSRQAPTAHLPPAILAAKTVFISNAGADSGLFPSPFSGTPDRAYQEFYASLQSWNRYRLVNDPSQADLVFELQLTAPKGPQNPDKSKGAAEPLPMFRLVIYDRGTHYILWAFTESIENAYLQKTHDRNFDLALEELTNNLKSISQPSSVAPNMNP